MRPGRFGMATNNYPAIQKWEPENQLLFDFGYSYALLARVRVVLGEIAECDDYPVEVGEMIEAIDDFQEHRLKLRNTIYDNAQNALDLDKRLAALEKIVVESDRVMLSRIPSLELEEAIREARELYERK
jgi:hypothetical protein